MRVGILGTGLMGAAMARRLLAEGFTILVWDRNPGNLASLRDMGAETKDRPEEVVRDADVVVTMLPTVEVVTDVVSPLLKNWPADTIWLQTSSVGADEADRLVHLASEHGVVMVDAPVSGSTGPAEHGQLTILASGPETIRPRLEPLLAALGSRTLWVGEAGTGSRFKVAINHWMIATTAVLAETLHLCESMNVDPGQFQQFLQESPLAMPYALGKLSEMRQHEYPAGFPVRLALKDLQLAKEVADETSTETPLLAVALTQYRRTADTHADEDLAALYELRVPRARSAT